MWSTEHVFSKTQSANETHDVIIYVHMFTPVATRLDRGREGLWCKMTGLFW